MPTLKCPDECTLQESIASLWRNVEEEYINTHREAARWSNLSIEATSNYSRDCKKRALPVIKWVKYHCQQRGLYFDCKSVHMIDHSKDPYEVRPYFVFTFSAKDKPWMKIDVTVYAPKTFWDVQEKVNKAFAMLKHVTH